MKLKVLNMNVNICDYILFFKIIIIEIHVNFSFFTNKITEPLDFIKICEIFLLLQFSVVL